MNLHDRPIAERIDWVFEVAREYSAEFSSPETYLARARHLAQHPTSIVAMKCMDGRINLSVATRTPPGVILPLRNLGGMFDLGWPHLGEVLVDHVMGVVSAGRRVLILITYHFSRGDRLRSCAGFGYDTAAAIAHTQAIRRQVEHTFGARRETVYPLVCGFETDEDALILHGEEGAVLDLSTLKSGDAGDLALRLAALFPSMPAQMRADLLPLVEGNLDHVARIRGNVRTLDIEHREWMICIGRGFEFLHQPNLALIIGPFSPNLDAPVRTAAAIIRDNMRAGRIRDDGFLLLASAPYKEVGVDRARAELKAGFLSRFAAEVIRNEFPDLAGRMFLRTTVRDEKTRRLEAVESADD